MQKALLAFDTDHIKKYVFRTSSLKEIRGASAILDRLNRQDMPRVAGGEQVFANGGSGLFLVDSAAVGQISSDVGRLYRSTTHSASVSSASVDVPDGATNFGQELSLLRHRLREQKTSHRQSSVLVTHPLLRFCSACGIDYAKASTDEDALCLSCVAKREEDTLVKQQIQVWLDDSRPETDHLWGRLIHELRNRDFPLAGNSRPESFGKLGEMSSPSGYMGLIYADGDGMGNIIEHMSTLDELRRFALAVDSSLLDAVADAAVDHLQPEETSILPFDILLLGGDDLVMATTADRAIETAIHIVERFTQLTEERWGHPLNLSASVVLCHVTYPIGSLIQLAESSLSFAKREAARRDQSKKARESGLINFLVVSSSNHLNFQQYFHEVLRSENNNELLVRTCRPYEVHEMRKLLDTVREMRSAPRGKLEQLRSAVFKSRHQANIDAMMAVLRLHNDKQRDLLLRLAGDSPIEQVNLPWIKNGSQWMTRVLDVVELLDFVG